MISRISEFLWGEAVFFFDCPAHIAADAVLRSGVPCFRQKLTNGFYTCSVERRDRARLERFCARGQIPCSVIRERGVLPLLKKAVKRPGLIVGLILSLFLLFQSANYVWDIEITGNERLSDGDVLSLLENYGFFVGCRHASLDMQRLCNVIPMENDGIAWISINMAGSVASVEVVENIKGQTAPEKEEGPIDLVAGQAGQIVRFELTCGRAVVSVGDVVDRGQLLVAGYSEKETGPIPRLSSGKVMASVVWEDSVEVPFVQRQRETAEPEKIARSAIFLGKEIFFYKKGLQSGQEYDMIEDEYSPTVFGIALPVKIKTVSASRVFDRTVTVDQKTAEEQAKQILFQKLHGFSGEILKTSFLIEDTGTSIVARCTAQCIVDIAKKTKSDHTEQTKN